MKRLLVFALGAVALSNNIHGAGLAPASIAGIQISALTTAADGVLAGNVGSTVMFAYGSNGSGTKTKNANTTPITYANYSPNGNIANFDQTESGMTGQVTLTFTSSTAGTFSLNVSGLGSQSGTFTVVGGIPPTLVSASLVNGVVTFTFSDAMDTNRVSFGWTAGQLLDATNFTNYRWSQDDRSVSFDAMLPVGLTISFTLNPTGFSGNFRNTNGVFLAADTTTQQFTVADRTNKVLSLDGNGDYVTIPSSSAIQPEQEFTIEAWLYPVHNGANHNPHLINKGDGQSGNSSRSYELAYKPDDSLNFTVYLGTDTFAIAGTKVPPNRWVHFAGVFNSSTGDVRIYTNGALAKVTTNAGSSQIQGLRMRQTSRPLVFGYIPTFSGTFGTGGMDEVRIWNVARPPAQIVSAMRSRLTGQEAGLVGYWNFDEGDVTDLTSGGLNGTRLSDASVASITGNDVPHAARLVSAIRQTGSNVELTFESETNRSQRIEYSGDLTNWMTLTNITSTTSTNSPLTVTDSTAPSTNRYYRIITP